MKIMKYLQKQGVFFSFLIGILLLFSGFKSRDVSQGGLFIYQVNNKIFKIENMKAYLRNTTGGRQQLSLSNDRFVKFFFINPTAKHFDLSTSEAKEAIIRYNEPGTNYVYAPKTGYVDIKNMDINGQLLSGEFEMEMMLPGNSKVIRITKGQIIDVPIVSIR